MIYTDFREWVFYAFVANCAKIFSKIFLMKYHLEYFIIFANFASTTVLQNA